MNDETRSAAARALVWQIVEQAAKARKDEAKAQLSTLEPGDSIAARLNGQPLGKATLTAGRARLVVTDEAALLSWLKQQHPTEVVESPNPAYLKALEARAKEVGGVIDNAGEVVPGVELQAGEPYVSVRKDKDAPLLVAQMLSSGQIALDGIKELEA